MTTRTLKKWSDFRIIDFAKIKGGKRLPKGEFVQDEKTAHPYIRVTDMFSDRLDTSKIKYITDTQFEKIKRYTISSDDVYVSNAGTIGLVGKVSKLLSGANLTENALKITEMDKSKITQDFLMYFLRSHEGQGQIKARTGGSSQPKLALARLADVIIRTPDVATQNEIADIVSSYDNLIENNTRRIQILEQTAQATYTEWFVSFRFPGHEKVKMIDSSTDFGKIPEGWEIKMLSDFFDFLEGPGIRNWQYTSSGCPFINIRLIKNNDIDISSANFISTEEANGKYKHFQLQKRDMIVSTSGTLGRSAIVRKEHLPLLLNTSVIRFKPMDGENYAYMYQFLNATYFQNKILSMASGSAQPNFGPIHLKQITMIVPSKKILGSFENLVGPLYAEMLILLSENQNLRQSRDLLLPKLVTGKIQV